MTNAAREPRILVEDLPAEHLGELEFLWDRRAVRARSGDELLPQLASIDRRIEGHLVGLEVVPRVSLPLLEAAVADKETSLAGAAALALLRIGGERSHAAVFAVLEGGAAGARAGVRDALLFGPAAAVLGRLRTYTTPADPWLAATASEVLAAHGEPGMPRALADWLAHPEPAVRLAACRAVAWLPAGAERLEPLARADADSEVRLAAFEAGAWQRAPWVLALGRERARSGPAVPAAGAADADAGMRVLFAALAESADAALFAALATAATLGPERWDAIAAYGNRASIEASLTALAAAEAPEAEAAGRAFMRMTGLELGAARRVAAPVASGGGADAAEFADEAFVPDPEIAQHRWAQSRDRFRDGKRWNRALDVDRADAAALANADLAARAEGLLRARFRGSAAATRRAALLLP